MRYKRRKQKRRPFIPEKRQKIKKTEESCSPVRRRLAAYRLARIKRYARLPAGRLGLF
jgi:hypothetical protein